MRKKFDFETNCAHCEYGQEIFDGDFCICRKKGVVDPGGKCSKFVFDPLKVKVSVRKIPQFQPTPDLFEKKN